MQILIVCSSFCAPALVCFLATNQGPRILETLDFDRVGFKGLWTLTLSMMTSWSNVISFEIPR